VNKSWRTCGDGMQLAAATLVSAAAGRFRGVGALIARTLGEGLSQSVTSLAVVLRRGALSMATRS
jgi:hypothetical protein